MKWTNRKKIGAAVLGLAVVAFVLDRTGPSKAAATDLTAGTSDAAARPLVSSGTIAGARGDRTTSHAATDPTSLATRLHALAEVEGLDLADVPDAFRPSRGWFPEPKVNPDKPAATNDDRRGEQFRSRHHLTAVIASRRSGIAIVEGATLRLGQTIHGFTLIAVKDRTAVLSDGALTIELTLADPTLAEVR